MPRTRLFGIVTALALTALCGTASADVLTQFTYQGVLKNAGSPVNSATDLRFSLWTQAAGGAQVGSTVDVPNASVTSGLFTATIDFGTIPFAENQPLYLQIAFRNPAGGVGPFTTMLQRQPLTSAPFSIATRGINVDVNNNVGVGTSTPAARFQVSGGAPTLNDAAGVFEISNCGGICGQEDNSEALRLVNLNSNGQVGIGFLVDSNWSINTVPNLYIGTDYGWPGNPGPDAYANDLIIKTRQASTSLVERFRINGDNGFMGIGTSTPQAKVDIRFSAPEGGGIKVTDTVGGVNAIGVDAIVNYGWGVRGEATATAGTAFGVYGTVSPSNASAWGVYSNGRLGASGTKSFMIDHPLDPEGAMLLHYSCESPEPQNRYNGNAVLDGRGMATVQLPDYFGAINTDFRYQLTAIGAPGPSLYIAQEVVNNRFVIAGGQPGMKVSWEVTANRSDRFVQQMGAPVEVRKAPEEQGKYLMPELYGQSPDKAMYPRPAITPDVATTP